MTTQSIENRLQQTLSFEDALKILNHSEKGVILFSDTFEVVMFNQTLERYGCFYQPTDSEALSLDSIRLYEEKRTGVRFPLFDWLTSCASVEGETHVSPQLWLKSLADHALPVVLQLSRIEFNNRLYWLLSLNDKSWERKAEAQQRLMNATHTGQFITSSNGFIMHPNEAFLQLTGLDQNTLSNLTYIDWLKKQVSLQVPFDKVIATLLNKHHWSGEVEIFTETNEQFKAQFSISMLVDPKNNIEHFIGLLQDLTEQEEAQATIEKLSYYDRLTGLANKSLLHDLIQSSLTQSEVNQSHHALLYIGLDGVKIINDTFGHRAGDDLLIQVAEKVSQQLSRVATENATLARLDGSNFAILYNASTQDKDAVKEEVAKLSEELIETIHGRYQLPQGSVHTSASIGSCVFPLTPELDYAADQILSFADMAMFEAKKHGGNQSFLFETSLVEKAQKRLELIEALNHSELDEEFQIYFQPQVDSDGKAVSAETLIRWFHPELGLVSPSKFIPIAEEGRQIIKIGLWVLHKAFLQIKAWNRIRPDFRVAINISPVQFHEQSFIEIIIGLVKFTHVNPQNITLELTEGVLIKNAKLAMQKIQHLVSLGFEISIDDFGTGYSSLSYLQKLPIHELKIDQSFIHHLRENPDDEAIVNSIIQLAQSKNLKLVAEGIETQQQVETLTAKQPEIKLQGYHFSKPIPAIEFEKRYIQQTDNHIHSA
ncbi:sensor domain-containing protein [Hydrogenovibrio kuenenii]|uniref:sensor domain-containing protein n=1 Tax=Hydrogenovibrio kuenenii TaxID=63658 RepID=UPI00046573A3|nr:EAL domain-containing protein [Hydrogenovibrio kuenenii]